MEKYNIKYSPVALDDLDQVWLEVLSSSGSIDVTDQYVNDLLKAISSKSSFPYSGTPLIYMGEATGIYYVIFKSYMAFYRVSGEDLEVGRILFARSDYIKTLFGKSAFIPEDTDD